MKKFFLVVGVLLLIGFTLTLTGCVHFPWHGMGH